jgi:hypothetical protein
MKIGDLVGALTAKGPRWGVIVDIDDERTKTFGGPEDQATIQVMWPDMKIHWECPLDIQVLK